MSSDNRENKYAKGFYHAQAGIDSGDPEVQMYKRHHESSGTLYRDSSGLIGVFFIAAIFGILDRLGRIRLSPEMEQWLIFVLGLVGLLLVASILNIWLPKFIRTAVVLFASALVFLLCVSIYKGYDLVYVQKDYDNWLSYFSVRAPISAGNFGYLSNFLAVVCGLLTLLVPFFRWFSMRTLLIVAWLIMILIAAFFAHIGKL